MKLVAEMVEEQSNVMVLVEKGWNGMKVEVIVVVEIVEEQSKVG